MILPHSNLIFALLDKLIISRILSKQKGKAKATNKIDY